MGGLAQVPDFEAQEEKSLTRQCSAARKAGRTHFPIVGVKEVWIFPLTSPLWTSRDLYVRDHQVPSRHDFCPATQSACEEALTEQESQALS